MAAKFYSAVLNLYINLTDMPDVFGIIADSSVRTEFSRIAHIQPHFFADQPFILKISDAFKLCFNIVFQISEKIVIDAPSVSE